ncbi:hypothetical protein F5Y13DRAFT_40747 [Hypoxylon sp. FL1857]|nr:hypothetical protein F5Y13DRAFT_40747 [Hypoxylon sp. FL1857]
MQSPWKWLLATTAAIAVFQLHTAAADLDISLYGPYDYYVSSPLIPRPWADQFETYFPNNNKILINISTGICNLTLHDYHAAFRAPHGSREARQMLSICNRHEACIYGQLVPSITLNYQGASIFLGLAPYILSALGPTIAELSLLSVHRPLLSLLISLGAPVSIPTRMFEFEDPRDIVNGKTGKLVVNRISGRVAILISAIQYVLAVIAATNVIATMVAVGRNTTLAWACTTQFAPLLWAVLALFVASVAMVGTLLIKRACPPEDRQCNKTRSHPRHCTNIGHIQRLSALILGKLGEIIRSETTICANRNDRAYCHSKEKHPKIPKVAVFLHILAGCMSFVLFLFGTAVFSALQLVTFIDAFIRVIARLIASSVICRLILIFELSGLRASKSRTERIRQPNS